MTNPADPFDFLIDSKLVESIADEKVTVKLADEIFECNTTMCGINTRLKGIGTLLHETGEMWSELTPEQKAVAISWCNRAIDYFENGLGDDVVLLMHAGTLPPKGQISIGAGIAALVLLCRQERCRQLAQSLRESKP